MEWSSQDRGLQVDMPERAGQNILIVEDDELFRKSLSTFVTSLGYGTAVCASAEEALGRGDLKGVDLCIVDYHLPGMSGVGFLDALRERGLHIPVLLMSGYLNEAIRTEAIGEGALEVLHKPMDMALLVHRLERVSGHSGPGLSSPARGGEGGKFCNWWLISLPPVPNLHEAPPSIAYRGVEWSSAAWWPC